MKKTISALLTAVMLLAAITVAASAATANPEIQVAYGTPVIDGTVDAVWANATAYQYDKYNYVTKTEVDLDPGQFRILWDENYLYYLFEINDTTLAPDDAIVTGQWYTRDGVALTLAPFVDETNDAAADTKRSFWFIIRTNATSPNYSSVNKATFITEDAATYADTNGNVPADVRMYAVSKSATGYTVEVKINVKAAGVSVKKNAAETDTAMTNVIQGAADFKLEAGTKFMFDTWTNDNAYTADNTAAKRDNGYTFADRSVGSYKNNSLKATAVLLEKPAEQPEPQPQPSNPTTGDTAWIVAAVAVMALGAAVITLRKVRG